MVWGESNGSTYVEWLVDSLQSERLPSGSIMTIIKVRTSNYIALSKSILYDLLNHDSSVDKSCRKLKLTDSGPIEPLPTHTTLTLSQS
jgi:hypothetical protein